MCTSRVGVAAVETLDDHALPDLIEHGLAALGARPLDGHVDDTALAESVERLHRVETVAAAEKLRHIAEVDARQAWRGEGARSTADLLARRLRLTRGEARAQAETAVGLEGLPETAAAVRAGTIGLGQAQVAVQTAKELRPDVREDLDRLVAGDGETLDRRQLRERVDEWTHTVDPAALGGRERRAWTNRRLSVTTESPDGVVRGAFELDPVGGATLIAALDPLARKTSAADDRTYPQRMADALVELARRALDAGDLPQVAVQRPHVILIATAEALDGKPGAAAARLDGVGPVSAATAQMICCDAETTQVFMTRNHEVLDMGRRRREPTREQRIAVIARDQTCVGCGAPASRCQIHHVRWWTRDLGPTDEENLCLVCWDCHAKIHHDGWLVVRDPHTGRFSMHPPDPHARQHRRRASRPAHRTARASRTKTPKCRLQAVKILEEGEMNSRGKALVAALAAVTALALAACGGGGQLTSTGSAPKPAGSQAAEGYVDFVEPQNGATVSSPATVKMKAEGITIEPAGAVRPGAGHFHVMIDTPCPAAGQVIPADDTHKHYGKGQTEAMLELTPGQHTLCLQAADGAHKALALPTKTITITVR